MGKRRSISVDLLLKMDAHGAPRICAWIYKNGGPGIKLRAFEIEEGTKYNRRTVTIALEQLAVFGAIHIVRADKSIFYEPGPALEDDGDEICAPDTQTSDNDLCTAYTKDEKLSDGFVHQIHKTNDGDEICAPDTQNENPSAVVSRHAPAIQHPSSSLRSEEPKPISSVRSHTPRAREEKRSADASHSDIEPLLEALAYVCYRKSSAADVGPRGAGKLNRVLDSLRAQGATSALARDFGVWFESQGFNHEPTPDQVEEYWGRFLHAVRPRAPTKPTKLPVFAPPLSAEERAQIREDRRREKELARAGSN
jgi:hypothetical protein